MPPWTVVWELAHNTGSYFLLVWKAIRSSYKGRIEMALLSGYAVRAIEKKSLSTFQIDFAHMHVKRHVYIWIVTSQICTSEGSSSQAIFYSPYAVNLFLSPHAFCRTDLRTNCFPYNMMLIQRSFNPSLVLRLPYLQFFIITKHHSCVGKHNR